LTGNALYNVTFPVDKSVHNSLIEKYLADEKAFYLNYLRLYQLQIDDEMFCWAWQHCSNMPNPDDAAALESRAYRATWRQYRIGVVPIWMGLLFIL